MICRHLPSREVPADLNGDFGGVVHCRFSRYLNGVLYITHMVCRHLPTRRRVVQPGVARAVALGLGEFLTVYVMGPLGGVAIVVGHRDHLARSVVFVLDSDNAVAAALGGVEGGQRGDLAGRRASDIHAVASGGTGQEGFFAHDASQAVVEGLRDVTVVVDAEFCLFLIDF